MHLQKCSSQKNYYQNSYCHLAKDISEWKNECLFLRAASSPHKLPGTQFIQGDSQMSRKHSSSVVILLLSVTGKGPGLAQVCLRLAHSVWAPDFTQERFHNMRPGVFESTFIKAGDRERKGLGQQSARGEPRQSCFGSPEEHRKAMIHSGAAVRSLRCTSQRNRSEPKRGCCQLTGKSEKGALETG